MIRFFMDPAELCNITFIDNILLLAKKKQLIFITKYIGSRNESRIRIVQQPIGLECSTIWKEPDSFQGNYVGHNQPQNQESKGNAENQNLCFSY